MASVPPTLTNIPEHCVHFDMAPVLIPESPVYSEGNTLTSSCMCLIVLAEMFGLMVLFLILQLSQIKSYL
jgi:hypothetical protein